MFFKPNPKEVSLKGEEYSSYLPDHIWLISSNALGPRRIYILLPMLLWMLRRSFVFHNIHIKILEDRSMNDPTNAIEDPIIRSDQIQL